MVIADDDLLVLVDRAAFDAADAHTANEFVIVDGRDEHLQRPVFIALRGIDIVDDCLKQRDEIRALVVGAVGGRALAGGAEDRRGIELFFGGVQVEQQLKHLVHDLMHTGVRPVDLVDDNDDLVAKLQRLLQHEARLRHRAFESVNEQQTSVCHVEHTLHLTSEVRVSRSVYNIYLGSFPVYRNVLRKNGYTSLTLQVVAVEHLAAQVLSVTEQVTGQHHFVHKCGLTMVYVGNNSYVSDILHTNTLKVRCKVTHFFRNILLYTVFLHNIVKNISSK